MFTNFIVTLIDRSRRFAWPIIILTLALTIALGFYAADHFKINTDVNQLLSSSLPWRQREAEIEKAFPQKVDTTVIVIDAATPDAADIAAAMLAAKLKTMVDKFTFVQQPDAIPFFRKEGLLLLSKDELTQTLGDLTKAQPLLGSIAGDPSLRGLFGTLDLMAQGVQHGAVDYKEVDKPFEAIAETIEAALAGQYRPLPLQSLVSANASTPRDLRKIILVKPVLDYGAMEPGKAADDLIRETASQLGFTPAKGIHVRLTGSVPLNDEEFASVANGTGFATVLSGILVAVILWLALRSLRLIAPILISLAAGLIITTAIALAVVKSLNLISVAFAVMFIGIAVDFGIQFGVRYRAQHFAEPDHAKAMQRTAHVIAMPLAMAAGSTALGFLSFMPTDYRGVSELGFIAGIGMVVAFALTITLLPALFAVFNPPAEKERIGFGWMAPVDHAIAVRRKAVLIIAFIVTLVGLAICSELRFDFDPLDLKDPKTESVSTLFDLMRDPTYSPYVAEILSPNLADADATAAKLQKLPEVDHTLSLSSFVPDDQNAKLALIADTRTLLEPTLAPLSVQKAPTDDEIFATVSNTAAQLHQIGGDHQSADRLAAALDTIDVRHSRHLLDHLKDVLITPIVERLDGIRELLKAEPVTVNSITDDLRRDWITPGGKALLQVYPKGNPRDGKVLAAFADAVQRIVPDANGPVISIRESGRTITGAFIHAGCYALVTITLLLLIVLRNLRDTLVLIAPLILAGILTLATIVVIGLPLNFANIIALPLLLSLGVSYAIYFVSYWRFGLANPLQSSMARAVLFSASTALVAFGSLGLSSHPGTSSMGKLLTVALLYSLTCTFFVLPALLGRPKDDRHSDSN